MTKGIYGVEKDTDTLVKNGLIKIKILVVVPGLKI